MQEEHIELVQLLEQPNVHQPPIGNDIPGFDSDEHIELPGAIELHRQRVKLPQRSAATAANARQYRVSHVLKRKLDASHALANESQSRLQTIVGSSATSHKVIGNVRFNQIGRKKHLVPKDFEVAVRACHLRTRTDAKVWVSP